MPDKNFSDMTDDEVRELAGASTSRVTPDPDWPATRAAIDTAISRARREIQETVLDALRPWVAGIAADSIEEQILSQVKDSLDDIDQTIPPAEDDDDD
jgi:hypothetical protein